MINKVSSAIRRVRHVALRLDSLASIKRLVLALCFVALPMYAYGEEDDDDPESLEEPFEELEERAEDLSLAKAAQKANNPVSDVWLLITQNDYTIVNTPEGNRWQNSTTLQPVMPVPILDDKWNLVNRVITGVVSSPVAEDFDSPNFFRQRTTGNTDTVFFSLVAPNRDDGWIWASQNTPK